MNDIDGGYNKGYESVCCFWGTDPGTLVVAALEDFNLRDCSRVLDLGCGEGKNSAAFARLGCRVDAVDCSFSGLQNGIKAFPIEGIRWIQSDVRDLRPPSQDYDLIICYGLFHCLNTEQEVSLLIKNVQAWTRAGGRNILCAFNDGPHDLSAHPEFSPLLLSHRWYKSKYSDWRLVVCSDSLLKETHPHNGIPHYHSMTRILAVKP